MPIIMLHSKLSFPVQISTWQSTKKHAGENWVLSCELSLWSDRQHFSLQPWEVGMGFLNSTVAVGSDGMGHCCWSGNSLGQGTEDPIGWTSSGFFLGLSGYMYLGTLTEHGTSLPPTWANVLRVHNANEYRQWLEAVKCVHVLVHRNREQGTALLI